MCQLGATIGYLTFLLNSGSGNDDGPLTNIVLYTFMGNNAISKTSHAVGGTIAPIIFTKAIFGDVLVTKLVGGFNSFVLPWNEDTNISVVAVLAVEWLKALNLTSAMVDINAFDNDDEENGFDLYQDTLDVKDVKGIKHDSGSKNNGMNQIMVWAVEAEAMVIVGAEAMAIMGMESKAEANKVPMQVCHHSLQLRGHP